MSCNLFVKLANLSSLDKERAALIDGLPAELQTAMLLGDSVKIRQVISPKTDFPDARTVARCND